MKPNDKAYQAAILAIKENGPYYAGSKIRESMAKDLQEIMRINNELVAERDALLARLQAAADRLEKLAGDMRPPNNITPQLFMLANSIKQNAQRNRRSNQEWKMSDDLIKAFDLRKEI